MNRRATTILCFLILASWIGVQYRFLIHRPMNSEECGSWKLATHFTSGESIERVAEGVHPPLFFLLLRVWTTGFGDSQASLRSLTILFGAVSLVLAYLNARDVDCCWQRLSHPDASSRSAGVIAIAILATSGTLLHLSNYVHMYSMALALSLLSVLLLLRAVFAIQAGRLVWCLYSVSIAALLYTHYSTIFLVAAQLIFLIILSAGLLPNSDDTDESLSKRIQSNSRIGLLSLGIGAASFAPWIHTYLEQTRRHSAAYWGTSPSATMMMDYWSLVVRPVNPEISETYLSVLLSVGTIAVAGWFFWRGSVSELLIALMVTAPTVVPVLLTFFEVPIVDLQARHYWLISFAFFGILCSLFLMRIAPGPERWAIVSLIVVNNLYWSGAFVSSLRLEHLAGNSLLSGAKGAASYILQQSKKGEFVIARSPDVFIRLQYYLRDNADIRSRLTLIPQAELNAYSVAGLISDDELSEVSDYSLPEQSLWVVSGSSLDELLFAASLPSPWQVTSTEAFGEPLRSDGKIVISCNKLPPSVRTPVQD